MRPVIVEGSTTQVEHGETAEETGAMLGMNSHALGIRHDKILGEGNTFMRSVKKGIDDYLAATADPRKVPIVNLQCDIDHPTQTLADYLWMREVFGDVRGKKIALTWAYSPSYAKPLSVPQGVAMLLTRYGADVTLAHPEGYGLMDHTMETSKKHAAASGGAFKIVDSMDAAFKDADIVYPKSWGPYDLMLERIEANKARDKARMDGIEKRALERNAKYKDWICDERRMGLTKNGKALYMHPLPADIGDEVSTGVMARYKVEVARQAQKKMYIIMAMLAVGKVPDLAKRLESIVG
jgi:knotted carbamoyltransferase YgeW